MKVKVIWLFFLVIVICQAQTLSASSHLLSSIAQSDERVIVNREGDFPDNTIKVVDIFGLQSPKFPMDFEIKVKNVSEKPIYGIAVGIIFNNTKKAFKVYFGKRKYVDIRQFANIPDGPLMPGEVGRLVPDKATSDGFYHALSNGTFLKSSSLEIRLLCQIINFGDGTGFIGSNWYSSEKSNPDIVFQKHIKLLTQSSLYLSLPSLSKNNYGKAHNIKFDDRSNFAKTPFCGHWVLIPSSGLCIQAGCLMDQGQLSGSVPKIICQFETFCIAEGTMIVCYDDFLVDCDWGWCP